MREAPVRPQRLQVKFSGIRDRDSRRADLGPGRGHYGDTDVPFRGRMCKTNVLSLEVLCHSRGSNTGWGTATGDVALCCDGTEVTHCSGSAEIRVLGEAVARRGESGRPWLRNSWGPTCCHLSPLRTGSELSHPESWLRGMQEQGALSSCRGQTRRGCRVSSKLRGSSVDPLGPLC